jgi:hypothetical protein
MTKKWVGIAVPPAMSLGALGLLLALGARDDVRNGVALGFALALVQSWLATAAIKNARTMRAVYRIWVAGIVVRMLVLAGVYFWVAKMPAFHLMATLMSVVAATTVFLVIETYSLLTD